jgi:hypothetical protein
MNITRKTETSNAREYLRQQFGNVLRGRDRQWILRDRSELRVYVVPLLALY